MSSNPKADQFSPASLSLADVFTNGDPIYQIPDYQRPYSWTDEQVRQLWEDLYEAYQSNLEDEESNSNYFLGSLIIIQKDMAEDVVDGQQRLTTLMILLCVIRQVYPGINKRVDPKVNPNVVRLKKIQLCISTANEMNRLRLQSDPTQASNFEELIFDESIDFSTYEKPTKKEIESDPKYRYINTAAIFYEYLNGIGETNCGVFLNYLMNKVRLIKITCYDESFAIKLFQVLNDRGLDLSPADIIKGYLLSSLNEKDNKHNYDTFMADWRLCEEWTKELDANLTDMFTYYEYYLLASNPKKSLVEELKVQFKNKASNTILRDFKNFVDNYRKLYNSGEKVISSFWYLPWDTYWATALITVEQAKYQDKEELQRLMLRFFYLYYISGKTLNSIKQTCFNLITSIKKNEPINKIKCDLTAKLKADDIQSKVLENLKGEVYYEGWIKPLLILVEYWQTDSDEVAFIDPDPKSINIEHIYPQNAKTRSEWDTMFKNGEKYLNTLGNLALLSGAKNRYAQNFIFDEKINIYQGFDKYGNKASGKNGKITVYRSTQQIVDDYKAGTYNNKWNEKAVQARHNSLCEQIGSLLGIDVSSILYN